MLADTRHESFSNECMRRKLFRHRACNKAGTAPIVLHGKVLQVLLDRCHWENGELQFTRVHTGTELTSRQFA
jgi:hypothetical protein